MSFCTLDEEGLPIITMPMCYKNTKGHKNIEDNIIAMTNIILILRYVLFTFFWIQVSSQPDEFTYIGFDQNTTNLSLSEFSKINKNGILRLTSEDSLITGHAFYPSPFLFKNSTNSTVFSFSTCFAFSIHPKHPNTGGHGLAFTIVSSKDEIIRSGLPGEYLGQLNFSNHLFAVEFDTVQDFKFGDINDNHVGIDINSLVSKKSARAAFIGHDSVTYDVNIKSGNPILAWIEYDSITNVVNVTISPNSWKPRIPVLSYQVDLSPVLDERMYVGFSASTGSRAAAHYVTGWSFKINGEAISLALDSLPSFPLCVRETKKKHYGLILGVSVGAVSFILASILIVSFLTGKIKDAEVIESWENDIHLRRYKYQELEQATQGYKESELLGFGAFGRVYKGTLPKSRTQVAVKRISHESKQGVREFISEISSVGRLRHRNIVQLLGWCKRGNDLLLVYELMPSGSLDKFLFGEPEYVLGWEQRFQIIKGAAAGLFYLHEGYEQIVMHRDVKASNVLLDKEMNVRLGDFGLSKLYNHGSNPGTTRPVGTFGYLAPELPRTGRSTTSCDVYAFGVLLLEVVCGRRPIGAGPEELPLVDWVRKKGREERLLDVVDEKMGSETDPEEVSMVLKLGLRCTNYEPSARPSMRQVVSILQGEVGIPELDGWWGGEGEFDNCLQSYESLVLAN